MFCFALTSNRRDVFKYWKLLFFHMSKKVYPVYSKWAEIFEDDIIEDIDEREWEQANNIEESDETILYALPYGFVRSHISEVKKVGITEGTLEKIKNTRENFQVKQIDSNGDIHDMGLVSDYWFDIDDIKSEENKSEKGYLLFCVLVSINF